MIAHISIGVRDVERSKRFYDAVLEPLGYSVSEPREGKRATVIVATASLSGWSRPSIRFRAKPELNWRR